MELAKALPEEICAVPLLSMSTSVPEPGTPAVQLPEVDQLLVEACQTVWANKVWEKKRVAKTANGRWRQLSRNERQ